MELDGFRCAAAGGVEFLHAPEVFIHKSENTVRSHLKQILQKTNTHG